MLWRLGAMTFAHPDWSGAFYPHGLPKNRWLRHYASQFDSIELNNTFHALPAAESVARWRAQVGPGFRFSVKVPRALTHEEPLAAGSLLTEILDVVSRFGESLGPLLFQFPAELTFEQFPLLRSLLEQLPVSLRVAVEFRSATLFRAETFRFLRERRVALVAAELEGHPESLTIVPTADFLYVRLLGRHGRFPDATRERFDPTPRLLDWHRRILVAAAESAATECWVLFNDDYAGHAPATLRRFAGIADAPLPVAPVKQRKLF